MTHAQTEPAPPGRSSRRPRDPHCRSSAVLGMMTALAIVLVAKGTFRDVDIYWHLIAGEELAAGISSEPSAPTWSFAPDPLPGCRLNGSASGSSTSCTHWPAGRLSPSSALSRAAAAMAVLAYTTLRGRPKILAGFPFAIGVVAVAAYSQERTQQFTYIGAAALGGVLVSGLGGHRLPRWWILVPVTVVWAKSMGMDPDARHSRSGRPGPVARPRTA